MPGILLDDSDNFEIALRRFKKQVEKAGILSELKKRQHYEKPSVQEKKKKASEATYYQIQNTLWLFYFHLTTSLCGTALLLPAFVWEGGCFKSFLSGLKKSPEINRNFLFL